jgi:hypothetical protein
VIVRCTLSHYGWSRTLLLVLCAALVPLPSLAADTAASTNTLERSAISASPAPGIKAAVTRAVDRDLARRQADRVRSSTQTGVPDASSPSFFRTKTGVLVLAVFAAGVGYAIYSTQKDRIHSPGRE